MTITTAEETTQTATDLSAEDRETLAEQARVEGRPEAQLVGDAVRVYLDRARYSAAIEEGLKDMSAGKGVDAQDDIAHAREHLAALLNDAGETHLSTQPPSATADRLT